MKRWEILSAIPSTSDKTTQIEHIIETLLANRGITSVKEVQEFLHPDLDTVSLKSVGIDEKEVKKTVARIDKTKKKQKTIVIFGDYDVDGICGSAVLWEALYSTYKKAVPYIPHRADEGYGLSIKGIDNVLEKYPDTDLMVTVDNGIVAFEAVEYANNKGIDVIITDHHVKEEKIPAAFAVVHTTKLCGAGVAYLLAKQLIENIGDKFLDIVALATVADLVPLTGANRTLLSFGLQQLRITQRCGLRELFTEAKIDQAKIDTYEIGHIIAPRINATGRLSSALDSLRLVCTKDPERAKMLARVLGDSNKQRQTMTKDLAMHAVDSARSDGETKRVLVVAHESYNQGVIGLIASRLVETYYRPSLVISKGDLHSKGSARSVKGVNIIEMIRSMSSYIVQAGGHPMAAGFTIETAKIEEFKLALEQHAEKAVQDEHLQRVLVIDCELAWQMITQKFYTALQTLAPFGMANYEPVFCTNGVKICQIRTIGKDQSHYKLQLERDGKVVEAVAFNFVKSHNLAINDEVNIAYTIGFDTWNGNSKVVLYIKDITS